MAKLILKEIATFSKAELKEGISVLFSAHGVPQSYIAAGDPYQRQIEDCVKMISKEVQNQLLNPKLRPATLSKEEAADLSGLLSTQKYLRMIDEKTDNESSLASRINFIVDQFKRSVTDNVNDQTATASSSATLSASTDDATGEEHAREIKFHLSFQSRVGPVKWLQPYTEDKLIELGASGVKNLVVVPVSFVSEHIETLEEIDMEYREIAEQNGIHGWRRVPALNTDVNFLEDMADMVLEALEAPTLSVAEATNRHAPDLIDQQQMKAQQLGNTARNNNGWLEY
jgi:hypothetical protein